MLACAATTFYFSQKESCIWVQKRMPFQASFLSRLGNKPAVGKRKIRQGIYRGGFDES
jgi:hypothetical protein